MAISEEGYTLENIWLYEVCGDSWGVVKANSREEAEHKVREAYKKHSSGYGEYQPIYITSKEEASGWFKDCPDVLEVF